ncbi:MAG: SDR family oxidoreductase [Verrucomicrobia bacterium]|nr:SDR family oxidoreductase [Verrucomicrobiota bacterium]
MKRILITGASGLVGSHLMRRAAGRFDALGLFRSSEPRDLPGRFVPCDLTDEAAVTVQLAAFRPDIVIHCAAMADSDRCQAEPVLARRLNVDVTRIVTRHAREAGAKLVFLSTDVIFDGRKGAPYVEDDAPHPLSFYAETKVEAEGIVRAGSNPCVIVRTSLIYGPSPRGNRGVDERLGIAIRGGRPIRLFVDEFRAPISAANLADAVLELAGSPHTGIYHVAGAERLSRHDIGMAIARHFGWPTDTIEAKRIADVPMNPPRPADLALDTGKARAALKTRLLGLREGLEQLRVGGA